MKFLNHAKIGVIIAVIHILIRIVFIIFAIIRLIKTDDISEDYEEPENQISRDIISVMTIVVSVIMILLCSILLKGILKRRHKLMLPWLILSAAAFCFQSITFHKAFILDMIDNFTLTSFAKYLFEDLVDLGIPGLTIWIFYKLYKDIKLDSSKKFELVKDSESSKDYNFNKTVKNLF